MHLKNKVHGMLPLGYEAPQRGQERYEVPTSQPNRNLVEAFAALKEQRVHHLGDFIKQSIRNAVFPMKATDRVTRQADERIAIVLHESLQFYSYKLMEMPP